MQGPYPVIDRRGYDLGLADKNDSATARLLMNEDAWEALDGGPVQEVEVELREENGMLAWRPVQATSSRR